MAADHRPVLPAGEDGLDEAELAEAPLEGVELVLADPAGVGGVGSEIVEGHLIDRERSHRSGYRGGHGAGRRRKRARRRAELNRKLRQAFIDGAEERSRRELGRGLTPDELERILGRYPGDIPNYARAAMSRPIRVRRATQAEVDQVIALDREATGKSDRDADLRTAQSQSRLLVAERDGRIVGYATHGCFFGYDFLELVVVRESDRRAGVATAIINAVEAAAESGKLFTSHEPVQCADATAL